MSKVVIPKASLSHRIFLLYPLGNLGNLQSAVRLLRVLKVGEEETKEILNSYGIVDPVMEELAMRREIKKNIESTPLEKETDQPREFSTWLDEKKDEIKSINKRNHQIFNILINSDVTRAEKILQNIGKLLEDEKNYNFLFNLFRFDFSQIEVETQQKII